MTFLANTGRVALERLRGLNYHAAVLGAVLTSALQPRTWRRTVREALSRQIVATGAEAVGFVSIIALFAGVLVVVQVQLWVSKVAQSRLLGPVLVTVVIRELGPLMANFAAIARSGNAITLELANMKIFGEVRALDAQGVDPFVFLVLPRVLGVMVSTLCLTLLFIIVCLGGGYLCAWIAGVHVGGLRDFADTVTRAIGRADLWNVVTKSALPPLVWGTICCVEGLSVAGVSADVTRAASRAIQRSIISLFAIVTVISILTYT